MINNSNIKTHLVYSSSSGYTLVELMVSILIGLFLLTGAFQVAQVNKKNNVLQKSMQQAQKDGRFAINHLSYQIKTAGYSGFYGSFINGVENLLKNPTDDKWNISIPVIGFNNVSSSDSILGITGFKENTDVLVLKGMNSNSVPVISNANASTIVAKKGVGNIFYPNDIVVISDVDQASLVQIASVTITPSNTKLTLSKGVGIPGNVALLNNSYNSDAEISKYNVQMFYLKTGRNGSTALFKANLFNTAGVIALQENELVSDIKDMQITYAIDNNDDKALDGYSNASGVSDWNQLLGINLALLSSNNKDNVLPEKSSYSFDPKLASFVKDETASTTADKRLKRVFKAYVPLRN